MSTLARALAIAASALEGATDKNGDPLILHVARVVDRVGAMLHADDEMRGPVRIVAALHDVLEDGRNITNRRLRELFDAATIDAVEALTRFDGEDYLRVYIPRVCGNQLARYVKHADLLDNLGRDVAGEDPRAKAKREGRYTLALRMVADAIIAEGGPG